MDTRQTTDLLTQVCRQIQRTVQNVRQELGRSPKLCFAGAARTGKSLLFTTLFGRPATEVSSETAHAKARWGVSASFPIDDLPGYGTVGGQGEEERALTAMRESDLTVLIVTATSPPTMVERGLYDHLIRLNKPCILAVNKMDLVSKEQLEDLLERIRENFNLGRTPAVPVSAVEGTNLVSLCHTIYNSLTTDLRLPFIRSLRHLTAKGSLVNKLILGAVIAAGSIGFGLNPLPSDFFALAPLQISLVVRVGEAYGYHITPGLAKEFLMVSGLVSGAGLGFRELFRRLPVAGPFVSAGIAASGTFTIGLAAKYYFASGRRMSPRKAARLALTHRPDWGKQGPDVNVRAEWGKDAEAS